jgi:hypothetical protein
MRARGAEKLENLFLSHDLGSKSVWLVFETIIPKEGGHERFSCTAQPRERCQLRLRLHDAQERRRDGQL